jgi:4-aminobutyrate aminotransferase-like enzyme
VLDVLRDQNLQANAARQGERLLEGFRAMQTRWEEIGDVRGRGLFLGIEMVSDRASKTHATKIAGDVVQEARRLGVLAGTDGPLDNVIKLRPAMTFSDEHAALLLDVFERSFEAVLGA